MIVYLEMEQRYTYHVAQHTDWLTNVYTTVLFNHFTEMRLLSTVCSIRKRDIYGYL